jgi:hypothetical protein
VSRQKSWFGGVRRKFFTKRTFSEDEAIAEFGGSGGGHPGPEVSGGFSGLFSIASPMELDKDIHEVTPADAPALTGGYADELATLRFQSGGNDGDLSIQSHEPTPADAPALTGGPWAIVPVLP